MYPIFSPCIALAIYANDAFLTSDEYISALQQMYISCVGIDDQLADMKKMAGTNTAVTAVGTVAGIGIRSIKR